ncbi:hypothetical protein HYDPIDRAFT_119083 [Hydnomerulius pinastri MD-312]|uniref:Uncharacterized protein n=1 Tax=Hydnomerulius pinastri MD-312 TaxID=994086 RepID=A0A0C9W894_9AGAM|nr:hypothetical protein HYDPIDRAFT_119083 [Hydnomerulius pinastri MD-312]
MAAKKPFRVTFTPMLLGPLIVKVSSIPDDADIKPENTPTRSDEHIVLHTLRLASGKRPPTATFAIPKPKPREIDPNDMSITE